MFLIFLPYLQYFCKHSQTVETCWCYGILESIGPGANWCNGFQKQQLPQKKIGLYPPVFVTKRALEKCFCTVLTACTSCFPSISLACRHYYIHFIFGHNSVFFQKENTCKLKDFPWFWIPLNFKMQNDFRGP